MTVSGKPAAKAAIIGAFNRLVLSRRALKPPVADILEEAGVARSTFYEHFDGRDMVLLDALEGPLGILADAASGTPDHFALLSLLDHFREQKRPALELLSGPDGARVARRFASLIRARLKDGGEELAAELATQQLGQLRLWLAGETRYPAERLAVLLPASAAALRKALADGAALMRLE